VVSYNVYRSDASTGPFTHIGNVAGTSYTDASVQSGQTYFYTVTSVDADNVESPEVTPVAVTIPSS
jgi:fibronectin type 3 domain-containing protein